MVTRVMRSGCKYCLLQLTSCYAAQVLIGHGAVPWGTQLAGDPCSRLCPSLPPPRSPSTSRVTLSICDLGGKGAAGRTPSQRRLSPLSDHQSGSQRKSGSRRQAGARNSAAEERRSLRSLKPSTQPVGAGGGRWHRLRAESLRDHFPLCLSLVLAQPYLPASESPVPASS